MAKVFFDHLIEIEEVTAAIDAHDLDQEEKEELVRLVDEIFHHHVLNIVLNHLPKEHHQEFITRLNTDPAGSNHLEFIKARVTIDIEAEIKKHSRRIKDDLLREITKAKHKT